MSFFEFLAMAFVKDKTNANDILAQNPDLNGVTDQNLNIFLYPKPNLNPNLHHNPHQLLTLSNT